MQEDEIKIKVKGSEGRTYTVTASRDSESDNMTMTCTCPAGVHKNICKHRLARLAYDEEILAEPAADAMSTLIDWYMDSDIEFAADEMEFVEQAITMIRAIRTAAKKDGSSHSVELADFILSLAEKEHRLARRRLARAMAD